MIDNLRHTVLCPLHHHTATEDTAEVSTLDGIHQTTGIDGDNTILLPINRIGVFLARCWIRKKEIDFTVLDTFKHRQQVIDGQRRSFAAFAACYMVGCAVLIRTFLDALILQLIVIGLTLRKLVVRFNGDFRRQAVIVRTIVRDVQSTITIDKGQVAITVQTTRMSCTQRNQVTVIDIVDGGCGVTEYCSGVSIDSGRTG